jgi:hypothetical protein
MLYFENFGLGINKIDGGASEVKDEFLETKCKEIKRFFVTKCRVGGGNEFTLRSNEKVLIILRSTLYFFSFPLVLRTS